MAIPKDYHKKYYQDHKEKMLGYYKKKVYCEDCDCEIVRGHYDNHLLTQKHIKNANKQKPKIDYRKEYLKLKKKYEE